MGNVRAKVSTYNAMPGWVVFLVELFLDESCDILFDIELLEGLSGDINSILLHILRHISVLNNCLSIRHLVK